MAHWNPGQESDPESDDDFDPNPNLADLPQTLPSLSNNIQSEDPQTQIHALTDAHSLTELFNHQSLVQLIPSLLTAAARNIHGQTCFLALQSLFNLSDTRHVNFREPAVEFGAIPVLHEIVSRSRGNTQLMAVMTMLNLSVSTPNKPKMVSHPGLVQTLWGLSEIGSDAGRNALVVLMNLADAHASADLIAENHPDVVCAILDLAVVAGNDAQKHALTFVGNLAHWGCTKTRSFLHHPPCNGLERLLPLLPLSDYVGLRACMIVSILAPSSLHSFHNPALKTSKQNNTSSSQSTTNTCTVPGILDDEWEAVVPARGSKKPQTDSQQGNDHCDPGFDCGGEGEGDDGTTALASIPLEVMTRMVTFLGRVLQGSLVHKMTWHITEPLHPITCIVSASPRHLQVLASSENSEIFEMLMQVLDDERAGDWATLLALKCTSILVHYKINNLTPDCRQMALDLPQHTAQHLSENQRTILAMFDKSLNLLFVLRRIKHNKSVPMQSRRLAGGILFTLHDEAKWNSFLLGFHNRVGVNSSIRLLARDLLPRILGFV